jgi:hypothetical protein
MPVCTRAIEYQNKIANEYFGSQVQLRIRLWGLNPNPTAPQIVIGVP